MQPIRAVQTRLLEKPSLLRDVCDEINRASDAGPLSAMQNMQPVPSDLSSRQVFKRGKCTCRLSTYAVEWDYDGWRDDRHTGSWGARWNTSSVRHGQDGGLFHYHERERENSWQLRLMCYRGLIGRVVQVSMQLRRGAGGFSISPSLDCTRLVPAHFPTFQLPWFFADVDPQDDSLFSTFIGVLQSRFQNCQASPRDVNPSGQTLLHVSPATCCRFNFCFD